MTWWHFIAWMIFLTGVFGPPLYRIADALERIVKLHDEMAYDLNKLRDILNIKRN